MLIKLRVKRAIERAEPRIYSPKPQVSLSLSIGTENVPPKLQMQTVPTYLQNYPPIISCDTNIQA